MKNPNIGTTLRELRKNCNLSVDEVSNILQEHCNYAAPKTIYGWESGRTQPDADTLMFLCELYNVDKVLETFGYKAKEQDLDFSLSLKEKELIASYRNHPDLQYAVDKLLDINNSSHKNHTNISYLNISRE